MGFHVDYDELNNMYNALAQDTAWLGEAMSTFNTGLQSLLSSNHISGDGADNVKTYLESTYSTVLASLSKLLDAHHRNCMIYKNHYQTEIDTGLHSIIDEGELNIIKSGLLTQGNYSDTLVAGINAAFDSVSDITWYHAPDYIYLDNEYTYIDNFIVTLVDDINTLEDNHISADFVNTAPLISAITAFINERLGDTRDFKSDFKVQDFANSPALAVLAQAYVNVDEELKENQSEYEDAIKAEEGRMEALQAEIEEREKKATVEKWTVTGLCVVGSVVAIGVIVASGGTATPLVVGSVSAVSGAIIAGNNTAADQYVQSGKITDWGEIGSSALLGGVSGFITGYIGAGISGSITNSLSSAGSSLLNSSSMAVRVGTNAVIGSTSEVISGVATRGVSTFATTMISSGGDISTSFGTAIDSAFDKEAILFDAALGGASGGIKGIKDPNKYQIKHKDKLIDPDERTVAVTEDIQKGSGQTISTERAYEMQETIASYTSDSDNIRSAYNNPDSPYYHQMETVDDYINNSPKWEGRTMRGINVDSDVAEKLVSGQEIDMLGPSSWSTDENVAMQFARAGTRDTNVIFVLDENVSGASVTHLSTYGLSESEVLSPSGIKYAMDSYERVHDNFTEYLYIYVHEK